MAQAELHPTTPHREQIVATALALVEETGLEAVTMRSLAQRLGYSPASLYMHFRGKDELLRAVAAERAQGLLDEVSEAASHGDPARALEAVAGRMFAFARDCDAFDRLIFDETPGAPFSSEEDSLRDRLYETLVETLGRVTNPSRESADQGPLAWGELRGIARLVRPSGPDPTAARTVGAEDPAELARRWAKHWLPPA
jgi:AcrR family transcriptional regulator